MEAHKKTDRLIEALENRLVRLYEKAEPAVREKVRKYFAQFEQADKEKRKQLEAGEITAEEYRKWRLATFTRGKDFTALSNEVAEDMLEVNREAVEQIGEQMPEVYAMNYNAEKEGIDILPLLTAAVALQAIKKPKVNAKKDRAWNKRNFTARIVTEIMQDAPIQGNNGICAASVNFTVKRNTATARTNARTWLTTAETNGRQALYNAAAKLGIEKTKTWITMGDSKVRHEHAAMNNVTVPWTETFDVAGHDMKGPGDRTAPTRLWINCRCCMKALGRPVTGKKTAATPEVKPKKPETKATETAKKYTAAEINRMSRKSWNGWQSKSI